MERIDFVFVRIQVTLKVMTDIKEAEYVNVEPADENDYEIVVSTE